MGEELGFKFPDKFALKGRACCDLETICDDVPGDTNSSDDELQAARKSTDRIIKLRFFIFLNFKGLEEMIFDVPKVYGKHAPCNPL